MTAYVGLMGGGSITDTHARALCEEGNTLKLDQYFVILNC